MGFRILVDNLCESVLLPLLEGKGKWKMWIWKRGHKLVFIKIVEILLLDLGLPAPRLWRTGVTLAHMHPWSELQEDQVSIQASVESQEGNEFSWPHSWWVGYPVLPSRPLTKPPSVIASRGQWFFSCVHTECSLDHIFGPFHAFLVVFQQTMMKHVSIQNI